MPKGQMVGNGGFQHYVAPNWSQMAAPVVSGVLNRLDQRQLDTDETAFTQRDVAAARAHMANKPSDEDTIGPYGVNIPAATPEAKLRWAQEGMLIPSLAPTMKAYLDDQLIKSPDRAEARQTKKDLQAAALADKQEARQQQLDFQRWQTGENNALRREIAANRGSGGGGSKASDFQIITDNEGNAIRVNKLTGEQFPVGKVGKPSAATEKTQADAATSVSNAQDGLAILESMKPLFGKATESGLRGDLENAIQYGTGYSTDSKAALKDLGIKAANLAKYADRKMFGPQFTDADVKAIKESVGNFGTATSYKERMAAYNAVKEIFERQAKVPKSFADDTANRKAANSPGGAPATPAAAPSIDDRLKKYK